MHKAKSKRTEISTTMTEPQIRKIDRLANQNLDSRAAFIRKTLIKTLKLKDDEK